MTLLILPSVCKTRIVEGGCLIVKAIFWGEAGWSYCQGYILGRGGVVLLSRLYFGEKRGGLIVKAIFWGEAGWSYCQG